MIELAAISTNLRNQTAKGASLFPIRKRLQFFRVRWWEIIFELKLDLDTTFLGWPEASKGARQDSSRLGYRGTPLRVRRGGVTECRFPPLGWNGLLLF
jgi:hypothetical protein